jgi:dipeptidyl aminopeptidase/acylaminoacyl peptidase
MFPRFATVAALLTSLVTARGADVPVPPTIRVEGVPPVPEELAKTLKRYGNIRSASFADWAPDGRAMLILTRFANTNQVHRVEFPGEARFQLTFEPERVLNAARRPGHDQFSFSMDEGGAEKYQIFLHDNPTGDVRRLTDGRSRNTAPKWSPTGRLLAFSSNARNGRDMDLYVQDVEADGPPRLLKEVRGEWTVADWSPDERRVAAIEYVSINESYVHLIDVESGETETLTPRGNAGPVAYGAVRWSGAEGGKALYWTTDRDSEYLRLARFDLATKESTYFDGPITGDVEEIAISDDGNVVAYLVNEAGVSVLKAIFTSSGQHRPSRPIPPGEASGLEFRPNSHEVGLTISTAQRSVDTYSVDFVSSRIRRWTRSETGGFDPETFAAAQAIEYPSFDGRMIPAFVFRPDAAKFPGPRPVLIDIHGGPEGQSRPAFLGRDAYLVRELGLVLIQPNVRGSAGYGKTYLRLDNGLGREGPVKDIGALLDWIKSQPDLDASRVGVTGGSYGGFMSLAVQTTYNDRIKAGIDVVGISNFVTFLKNTSEYRRDLRRAEYGDERDPEMRAFLERVSPLAGVGKIRTPILVVQGQNDPRVPISESEQVVEAVRRNGVPVWYVVGTDEGHGFAKKPNQDYLQAVEAMFLRRFLLDEAPDEKAAR